MEEELERTLRKVLSDALVQAMQRMLANILTPAEQGVAPKSPGLDEIRGVFPLSYSKLAQVAQKGGSKLDIPAAEARLWPREHPIWTEVGDVDDVSAGKNASLQTRFSPVKNAFGSWGPGLREEHAKYWKAR